MLRLKSGGGWFAAGAGFERALGLLSDGAFKVFAHICLHAERNSGELEFARAELAERLGKSRSALGRCLRELVRQDVCELQAAPNQHRRSRVRVRRAWWPYEVAGEARAGRSPEGARAGYVARVRRLFLEPSCVQGRFGAADRRLAEDWQRDGVSLEDVRRAILLGSVRKSMALIDHPGQQPIRSLRYFERLVEEVREESFPPGYWQHLEFHLQRCDRHRQARPDTAPGRADAAGK